MVFRESQLNTKCPMRYLHSHWTRTWSPPRTSSVSHSPLCPAAGDFCWVPWNLALYRRRLTFGQGCTVSPPKDFYDTSSPDSCPTKPSCFSSFKLSSLPSQPHEPCAPCGSTSFYHSRKVFPERHQGHLIPIPLDIQNILSQEKNNSLTQYRIDVYQNKQNISLSLLLAFL